DKGGNMPLHAFPTACEQTLRALSRYPSRTAFRWPGGSLSYQGAIDLIGRMQAVFSRLGLEPGSRVAFLTANRADSWCAGVAAHLRWFRRHRLAQLHRRHHRKIQGRATLPSSI